jgi:hypothetical protein
MLLPSKQDMSLEQLAWHSSHKPRKGMAQFFFSLYPELVNMRYIYTPTPPASSRRAKWRGGQCNRQTPTTRNPGTGTSPKSAVIPATRQPQDQQADAGYPDEQAIGRTLLK